MINTLIWRLKEAFSVLKGEKKAIYKKLPPHYPKISAKTQGKYQFKNSELEKYINSKKIEFIFSEFNENRVNAGGADLTHISRLEPSLSSLRNFFPHAQYTVYSDFDLNIEGVELVKITEPILQNQKEHPRHFYHLADYYKFKGLIDSDADIAISIDSDMFVWSDLIYSLITITDRLGFCVPSSSSQSMNYEIQSHFDTIPIHDNSLGMGANCNITPMTLAKHSERGKLFYQKCCEWLEKNPSRASIAMWNAIWETKIYPYVIPKEFCVVRGNEGIGNEVLLHIGHPSISEYYNVEF